MMATEEDQWGPSRGLVRTQSVNIDLALANEVFDHFCCQANTLKSILRSFSYLCEVLRVKPTEFQYFYPKIKSKLKSWKAQALWAKFDKRSQHKVYNRGKACAGQRVLVIGAGPCGLRTAIEAQLLGAKVVVIEKRDRFSRNNVLHLWPYNIHDLRGLGAKKFCGKFCAGAIDHISIRQLQSILLKVSLLLGVEVYESVGFEKLIEPSDIETGWRAEVSPSGHPVSQYEFDVLIGADGKRNTLDGFKRKEFRGKLAIAITANFIRKHDEAESHVEEISGVAFIFNQKYFNDLNDAKGIDLENIVYYKDETHYFVMTAKKQSLLDKGVIIKNESDTAKLLSPENIRTEKLFEYAREAADFATNYKLPQLDFAVNHYGKPDVAMFDFTSMFQAENSCRVLERHGHRLLVSLVGDSLLEPFWPTGTGCARGFFGGLDACWLMRQVAMGKMTMLEAVAERESIYRVLAQTTPENTSKDYSAYTVDPHTRYPTLNTKLILPFQVTHLVDTDNPSQLEEELRQSNSSSEPKKRRRKESHVSPDNLQKWLSTQVEAYDDIVICDMTTSFQNGLALCAIIHRYRPDLIDYNSLDKNDIFGNISFAFDTLEHELGIPPVIPPVELADIRKVPDKLTMMSYLSSIYELFRRDIPAVNRMSVVDEDEDDLLDAQLNRPSNKPQVRRPKAIESGNRISIGQLVASEAAKKTAKKRRSKESVDTIEDGDEVNKKAGSVSNKENLAETARLNKSAHRKRMLRLMERAEASAAEKQAAGKLERKSIKEEERYKVIEAKFGGGGSSKRRSGGSSDTASKYRENKRPKDLKRAIGKLDKDDWNIKNIEEKLLIKKDPEAGQRDKVPKWSKEAFQDKFNIMKGKLENGEDNNERKKSVDIDVSLGRLQKKLQEGTNLDIGLRGQNRVSALADDLFYSKRPDLSEGCQSVDLKGESYQNQNAKNKAAGGSEICHFCGKRVYVVERMSAEGRFFHRSCFRCDYCNVLLRLGSYIYHREGQFAGKFFCVPHSTENSLEKYRYRRKADEIRDAETRQRELMHKATNDWHKGPDAISNFLESLPSAHKDRLLSHKDATMRGTTPERAEFEASVDKASEEETPSIMDEDEWTDRNFGNSLLLEELPNTSEDSVSDLDSDDGLSDNERKESSHKLLTSKEARQLHKDWLNRWRKNSNDASQYENVSKRHSSDEEECPHGEEDHEADYEDSESESGHSKSDSGRAKLPVLSKTKSSSRQRGKKGKAESEEETSSDEDSSSNSGTSDSDSSDSDDVEDGSEFSSGTNTECEFTDSEGKPNPFHKELEVPKIVLQPGSPVAGYQWRGESKYQNGSRLTDKRTANQDTIKMESQLPTVGYSTRLQYKTPNISGRLQCEDIKQTGYVTRSTQRALSLKKNWVSEAPTQMSSSKKVNAAEMDDRLKSVMERLSNQQSLLKPADKPSTQMEHLLRNCPTSTSRITLSQSTSALRDPSRFKSPPPPSASLSGTSYHFYPLPYHQLNMDAIKSNTELEPKSNYISRLATDQSTVKESQNDGNLTYTEAESVKVPSSRPQEEDKPIVGSRSTSTSSSESSSESSETSSSESTQSEQLSPVPPPIPPPPIQVPDINVHPCTDENGELDVTSPDEFASCNVSSNISNGISFDAEFQTPSKSEDEAEVPDVRSEETDTVGPPVGTSSPMEETPVKEPVVIRLSNDEVTRIYQERNPLERLAKLNSLKQKESSVVRDMILGRVGAGSRSSSVTSRPLIGARRPRNMILTSTVPPPPLPTDSSPPQILINSAELQQNNFQTKSQSCHQLEQLSDFPLIDADDDEVSPNPPLRPERRIQRLSDHSNVTHARSQIASQPIQERTSSQQSTPAKKPFSLPATPLTDPEKFGIPVRNTSKHHSKSGSSSRKKLSMGTGYSSNSKSSDDTPSLASPTDQVSSTSNDIDFMDGIVSSESSSIYNSPAKKSTGITSGSNLQSREPRKTFMQTITGIFARGTTPDARAKSPENRTQENTERKSRSDSFLKFAKGFRSPNASQKSTPSSPEAPRADISEISLISHTSYPNSPRKSEETKKNEKNILEQEMLFKTISFQASHPSTPPVPLSRKITLKNNNSEESFSDDLDDGDGSPETSLGFIANDIKTSSSTVEGRLRKSSLPPEILEKILRKSGKSAKRSAKIAQVKRVRKAQEIQRQLEELDVRHKDLEERGVKAERNLRGETSNDLNHQSEGELMQSWFLLLAEKNALVRTEQELLVQAKQLELEDRSARLESELRDHLLRDSRSPESVTREGEILSELLEISEQREMLQMMLAKDKMRYQIEDKDIEAQMKAKGVHLAPMRKISNNQ